MFPLRNRLIDWCSRRAIASGLLSALVFWMTAYKSGHSWRVMILLACINAGFAGWWTFLAFKSWRCGRADETMDW